jgi:ferric-dicitrate binding protein FerR (iron transport regulator)
MNTGVQAKLPDAVLDQAISWLVRMQSGSADDQAREACLRWRQADPLHEAAWQALETSGSVFQSLPGSSSAIALDTLERLHTKTVGRRNALKLLGVGLLVSGAGALALRQGAPISWRADYATAVGERRQITLSDGTRLLLNTASAVDIHFSAERRLIALRQGEVFVTTGPDAAAGSVARSLWVESRHARLQAIGTAFGVREDRNSTRLRVEQGVVAIHERHQTVRVAVGEEYLIDLEGSRRIETSSMNASAWTQGQLVARRMRLEQLVQEFARYRRDWLSCDPEIAALEISGVFQLDDIDQAISALSAALPVRTERLAPFWTRIVARRAG